MHTTIIVGTTDTFQIDFKGTPPEPEVVQRAEHIIRANSHMSQPDKGYLLSCLTNGNYAITVE